jgi:ribosomal protein S18 acetylase RimI-like enzyme
VAAVPDGTLLGRIDAYCDLVPRAVARGEMHGPFTVFVTDGGGSWPYAARPLPGVECTVDAEEVRSVCEAQRQRGVDVSLEWVHELHPGLADVVAEAGLGVVRHDLMALHGGGVAPSVTPGVAIGWMTPRHPRLGAVNAAIGAAFGDSDVVVVPEPSPDLCWRLQSGRFRQIGAWDDAGAVGGGAHSPRAGITEITGVGVIPRARRSGVGAAITAALVVDALAHRSDVVFLSARDGRVAALYRRLGFERVGTACTAEPMPSRSA